MEIVLAALVAAGVAVAVVMLVQRPRTVEAGERWSREARDGACAGRGAAGSGA